MCKVGDFRHAASQERPSTRSENTSKVASSSLFPVCAVTLEPDFHGSLPSASFGSPLFEHYFAPKHQPIYSLAINGTLEHILARARLIRSHHGAGNMGIGFG